MANLPAVSERWIRAGGFRTRVLEAGDPDARPLLLLHDGAWGGSASTSWGRMIPSLATTFRVIAPDMLGYGAADKAIFVDRSPHSFRIAHLTALLEVLDITDPIDVVGNSFGGATALRALAVPRAFSMRSVTSISGSGGPWRTETASTELTRWDGTRDDLARVQRYLVDEFDGFEQQLDERFRWATAPGHYKAVKAANTPLPDALKIAVSDPWPAQIESARQPILLVRCLRDQLLDLAWAENVRAGAPHATIVDIDDRHSPNIDRPEELEQALRDFLRDT